jgi:hypothetical protein
MPTIPSAGRRLESLKKQAISYFGVFCVFAGIGIAGGDEALFVLGGFGASFLAPALYCWSRSRQPPTKEIMQLARARNGLLTLSEITTELDIEPHLAHRALEQLKKLKIASQRWQEIHKNVWEFPDYLQLPVQQSLDIARTHDGRITLQDLLAQGHSLDTAQQTLDTLSREGLARPDAADPHAAQVLAR